MRIREGRVGLGERDRSRVCELRGARESRQHGGAAREGAAREGRESGEERLGLAGASGREGGHARNRV